MRASFDKPKADLLFIGGNDFAEVFAPVSIQDCELVALSQSQHAQCVVSFTAIQHQRVTPALCSRKKEPMHQD
jgi:hypothetical protein